MSSMDIKPTIKETKKPKSQQIRERPNHWFALHEYTQNGKWDVKKAKADYTLWQESLPRSTCDCKEDWKKRVKENPPDFTSEESYFEWGVNRHNDVNIHLGKPVMDMITAYSIYREPPQQPPIDNLIVMTSLSPLPHHQTRQELCLSTWKKQGLTIAAVCPSQEKAELENHPHVDFFHWTENLCDNLTTKPTVKITEILQTGLQYNKPICLLNSDIELHGPQKILLSYLHNKCVAGIRHNYSHHVRTSRPEEWGLDLFIVQPQQIELMGHRDYGIGKTFWDYWIPEWHIRHGYGLEILAEPYMFHKTHPLHWTMEDLYITEKWWCEEFNHKLKHSPKWRKEIVKYERPTRIS
jgi:hypothetical protein